MGRLLIPAAATAWPARGVRLALAAAALVLVLPAHAANEECWGRGYRDGWCDGRGVPACAGRIPPRPPAAAPGQEDCDSRYVDGYVAGQKAGMPPQPSPAAAN